MANDLFHLTSGLLVLGLGNLGGRVAGAGAISAELAADFLPAVWAAAHANPTELIATGLERKLLLPLADGPFAAKSAAHAVALREAEIARICGGRSTAVLIGSLGERCVEALVPALAGHLRANGLEVVLILSERIAFEGACESPADLQRYLETADLLVTLSGQVLAANVARDGPISEAHRSAGKRLQVATEALVGALARGLSDRAFTVEAIRRALGSRQAEASLGGGDSPLAACQAALKGLSLRQGLALAVLSGHGISVAQAEAIGQSVPAGTNERGFLLGAARQEGLTQESVCLALTGVASVAWQGKIVSIESAVAGNT